MSIRWNDITISEREQLLRLYETDRAALELAYQDLGLNMAFKSFEAKLREHRNYRSTYLLNSAATINFERSESRQWLDYEVIQGDDAFVIGDVEVSDHHADLLHLALLDGMAHNIKRLIVAGDLIATDQSSLNAWVSTWKTNQESTFEDSKDMVVDILSEFANWFDDRRGQQRLETERRDEPETAVSVRASEDNHQA